MIDYGYGVKLGPLKIENLDAYMKNRNMPEIYNWSRQEDLLNEVTHEEWFYKQARDPRVRMYEILSGEVFIGVCGLSDLDLLHRRAEFSLYINTKWQKKGLATPTLKTLFKHGFYSFGLNVIWGESFDGNPACQIFEKLGMKKDGARTDFYWKNGRFIDAHLYSMRASEWKSLGL